MSRAGLIAWLEAHAAIEGYVEMTDEAPERRFFHTQGEGGAPDGPRTEYVRADIHEAVVLENKHLRGALRRLILDLNDNHSPFE